MSSEANGQGTTDRDSRRAADRLLLQVSRRGGAPVALLVITTLVLAGAELALPFVLGRTLDALIENGSADTWLLWIGLLVAALVLFDALDDLVTGATIARCTAWLRHTLTGHILALGARPAGRARPQELSSRLVANAADAGRVAPDLVRAGIGVLPAVGGTVALALIDPWLCVTFLAGMPLFVLLLRAFARDASGPASRYLDTQGTIASRLVDALSGGRTIAAAGTQDREAERILKPLPELHRHGIAMWRAQGRIAAQDAVLISLLEVAVLAVAGALLAAGRITPGQLLAASQYVLLAATLSSAVGFIDRLVRSRAAAQRINEVLDQPPVRYGRAPLPPGHGRIEFRGVTAGSADRPVLRGLDLVLPGGCLAAVVGRSGSGKSLCAALAVRLLDPDEGDVLLDGVALSQLSRGELRQAVGYGFERPVLIGETLADAIAFGDRALSNQEVVQAAQAARADDFIRRMPQGYATALADAPMSGGERQRVGLARTFAVARRLVVLDDVAASLDSVTEHHISEVLTGALADRTRIVVAHRASTASRADVVVWLEGGGVRAAAPHAQLWRDGEYRALFAPDGNDPPASLRPTGMNGGSP
ncbi:MAG: ABC transporter ATP-binding protein/permease [Actinomycetota bacterium]|nr:ABC transporter ATP-binding protein/permease [Actinomycetota bacterium]